MIYLVHDRCFGRDSIAPRFKPRCQADDEIAVRVGGE